MGVGVVLLLIRLLPLQKRALRVINFADFYAHTDPVFLKHRTLISFNIRGQFHRAAKQNIFAEQIFFLSII